MLMLGSSTASQAHHWVLHPRGHGGSQKWDKSTQQGAATSGLVRWS